MSRSFLRHKQPGLTRLFPHQGNKRFVIPNSQPGPFAVDASPKDTAVTMFFNEDLSGSVGAISNGFSVESLGSPLAVSGVSQPGTNEIQVTHAAAVVGDQLTLIYDGSGDWTSDANGSPLGIFRRTGVVT